MKILLCGGRSPLGAVLMPLLEDPLFSVDSATEIALADAGLDHATHFLLDHKIDQVLNLSVLTADSTTKVWPAPFAVAQAAGNANIPLLQLSDCRVLPGKPVGSFREKDNADNGEFTSLEAICPKLVLLRTGEIFGSRGGNVLTDLIASWQRGESAALALRDQFSPTAMSDVARVIVALLKQLSCNIEPWGVYHYCGADSASYHDFAKLVRQIVSAQPNCHFPMETHDGKAGLPPLNWALDCSKIRDTFGIKQHAWRAGLTSSIKRILSKPVLAGSAGDTHGNR